MLKTSLPLAVAGDDAVGSGRQSGGHDVIVVGVAAGGCDVGQRRGKETADVVKTSAPCLDGVVRMAVEIP